jgi:hypothetical protein
MNHHPIKALLLLVLLLGSFIWMGCDSSSEDEEPEPTDVDFFIGTWDATSLVIAGLIEVIGNEDVGVDAFTLTFRSDQTFDIEVAGADTVFLDASGTFELNETAPNKTITYTSGELASPVTMTYTFTNNNDGLELSFQGTELLALGFDLGEFESLVVGATLRGIFQRR